MSFIVTTITMLLFWFLLSGEFSVILVVAAVVSSLLVAFLSANLLIGKGARVGTGFKRFIRFVPYFFWLIWQIVKANIDVVYRALHPQMPIEPCIVKFKSDLKTDLGIAALSNSITLTPGTVTLSANSRGEYIVHALSGKHADDLLSGEMQAWVKWIEDA
ncbi:MAG: Na+/H+ antiporter subunit E [Deltaproteobacteria bacterium]|nr:Na+/H+ antiporter subunit E [Deltaproteobacteria bacterium]